SRTPQSELEDEEVLTLIRRGVKQRKDSIAQFTTAGRADLAESEQAELSVLETYLPQMMSRDEIKTLAEAKKAELGVTDKAKAGILTG
ncbi:GatB/YqeY domain-containing protein, partial [Streptomyces caeruleatus]